MAAIHFTCRATLIGLAPVLALGGCGPALGEYRVDDVRVVNWASLERADPELGADRSTDFLVRVQFSSATDVEVASDGGDLYVHADFCPFRSEYRIGAFGPYYGDRSRYGELRRNIRENRDGTKVIVVEGENLHPPRDPRTGRYVYTAYIIPYATAFEGPGREREGYDLRTSARDLCLRLDHPGYYLTRSKSQTFTVSRTAISAALRGHLNSGDTQFRRHDT